MQIARMHALLYEPFDPALGLVQPPGGEAPAAGSSTVRWNSWPCIRVPAAKRELSETATASRYPRVSRSDIRASPSRTPHMGCPSRDRAR